MVLWDEIFLEQARSCLTIFKLLNFLGPDNRRLTADNRLHPWAPGNLFGVQLVGGIPGQDK
jgi:hypothetical protein